MASKSRVGDMFVGLLIGGWSSLAVISAPSLEFGQSMPSKWTTAILFWVGGVIGGFIWNFLDPIRARGKICRYIAWVLSVAAGLLVWVLSGFFYGADLLLLAGIWAGGALGGGLALGFTSEWLREKSH